MIEQGLEIEGVREVEKERDKEKESGVVVKKI